MVVDVLKKKDADNIRKKAIEASNSIQDELSRAIKDSDKRCENIRNDIKELKEYYKSKNLNDEIGKKINFLILKKEITTKKDIDDYIKKNSPEPTKKPKKEYIPTGDVSSALELVESMVKQPKNIKKHNTSDDVLKTIFNIMEHKLPKNAKAHNTSDDVLKTIFDINETKLPKNKKPNTKEGTEIIAQIEEKIKPKKAEKRLLLDAYEFKGNKPLIEQLADSIKAYPEFDSINKTKIKKYSFDVVDKFNKKYPELMLRIFKDQKSIDKLLTKKANKVQKNILSEEKAVVRKKKYSEQAKEARKETKIKKYKHLDDMTDAELKKFKQAKNYYMRKSLTSDILPKGLNKSDPEGLNNVCKELAENGFDTMSEHLFMKIYEG